jgi:hypothetical protein
VRKRPRTGFTSLTVAAFFCLALFFSPLFIIIPPQATAPALVLVGVLMMQGLARIDMTDLINALPIRAHFTCDRADQQSRQRDGVGNAELYSLGSSCWSNIPAIVGIGGGVHPLCVVIARFGAVRSPARAS